MCGIGGYIKFVGCLDEKDVAAIREMCEEMEKRGRDAHGFIIIDKDGRVERLFKMPAKASTLWNELYNIFKKWMIGRKAVLFHTRATTCGTEKINMNNHPFKIENYYLAHNGSAGKIYLGRYYNYCYYDYGTYDVEPATTKRNKDEPETDSYQHLFKPLVEKLKSGKNLKSAIPDVWRKESVSGAIWLYDENEKVMYLYRGENPISYEDDGEVFKFMSTGLGNEYEYGEFVKVTMDGFVESEVIEKREVVVGGDVPNEIKLRRELNELGLDWDATPDEEFFALMDVYLNFGWLKLYDYKEVCKDYLWCTGRSTAGNVVIRVKKEIEKYLGL